MDPPENKDSTVLKPDVLMLCRAYWGTFSVISTLEAEVDFTGNKVIPTGMLREAIHGVAVGARFTDRRFRDVLDTSVRPLYEARGRVRVSFPNIQSERAPRDVNGLKITVFFGNRFQFNHNMSGFIVFDLLYHMKPVY